MCLTENPLVQLHTSSSLFYILALQALVILPIICVMVSMGAFQKVLLVLQVEYGEETNEKADG